MARGPCSLPPRGRLIPALPLPPHPPLHAPPRPPRQIPESGFEEIRGHILNVTSSSSRSSMPAIYGIVAAVEVERLKPLKVAATAGCTAAGCG